MIEVKDLTVYHILPGEAHFFISHKAMDKKVDLGDVSDITAPFDNPNDPAFQDKLGDWLAEHYDEVLENMFPETLNWLSQDEFVKAGGSCPVCGSVDILWDDTSSDFEVCVKTCWCQDCQSQFEARYSLAGYTNVITTEANE